MLRRLALPLSRASTGNLLRHLQLKKKKNERCFAALPYRSPTPRAFRTCFVIFSRCPPPPTSTHPHPPPSPLPTLLFGLNPRAAPVLCHSCLCDCHYGCACCCQYHYLLMLSLLLCICFFLKLAMHLLRSKPSLFHLRASPARSAPAPPGQDRWGAL